LCCQLLDNDLRYQQSTTNLLFDSVRFSAYINIEFEILFLEMFAITIYLFLQTLLEMYYAILKR